MKLSLTMICKDAIDDLKRLKPLVEPHIDQWVVVFPPDDPAIAWAKKNGIEAVVKDFTQPIEPEIREQMADYGLSIAEDYRLFNFAAARNESLKHATGDYVLWLDADDEPIGLENVKKFVEKFPTADVFDVVYDYFRDEEGNSVSDHVRERVVRNNGKWEWLGAELGLIHETLLPKRGYDPLRADIPDTIFHVKHHTDHVDASSLRNHTALLYEYLKTSGKDPRTTYYLGIEYFNRQMFELSIKILMEYIKVGGSEDDRYSALLKMGDAYHFLKQPERGRNAYLKAIEELPHRPEAYISLGESYHETEQWAKSNEFLLTGLGKKVPQTKHAINMVAFTFRPAGYIALNHLQLGKPKDAYDWFQKAAAMNPKHPWVKQYYPLFNEAKDLHEYVTSFVKLGQLAKAKYPKTLHALAEAVPDELMDQELLMMFKRMHTKPKVWSDKSVVYYCSAAFEDWGPDSLKTGCGGSEEAVIHLTKRWADMGYEVTVYCNCPEEKTVDGVTWLRYERFNPRDIFNIIIGWRNNPFIDGDIVANKKYIDMHDVPDLEFFSEESVKGVKILVKSQYHRSLFPDLPDDQFIVIPNGIDLDQFGEAKRTTNNLVWTSSYDRGLEHLLKMWPDIKKEVPDATLDVYYGFALYDKSPWGKTPAGQQWKQMMLNLLAQDGVTDHGRVNSETVAKAYLKADVWAYPTHFPEIDCITATKAMAAKCVPITTDFAVMKERNQGVMIEGDIFKPEISDKFKKELIALLKDTDRKSSIREKLNVAQYSWEHVATEWAELF